MVRRSVTSSMSATTSRRPAAPSDTARSVVRHQRSRPSPRRMRWAIVRSAPSSATPSMAFMTSSRSSPTSSRSKKSVRPTHASGSSPKSLAAEPPMNDSRRSTPCTCQRTASIVPTRSTTRLHSVMSVAKPTAPCTRPFRSRSGTYFTDSQAALRARTLAISLKASPLRARRAFSTIHGYGQRPRTIERPRADAESIPRRESPRPSARRTTPPRSRRNAASGAWRRISRTPASSLTRSPSPAASLRSSMCASSWRARGWAPSRLTDVRNDRGRPDPMRTRCRVERRRPSRATARQRRAMRGQSSGSKRRRQQPGRARQASTGSPTRPRVAALA